MRNIIIVLLVLVSGTGIAQTTEKKIQDIEYRMLVAGVHLKEYTKAYNKGIMFQGVGVSVATVSVLCLDNQRMYTGIAIGGILTLTGAILSLTAHRHIGTAGVYLSGSGLTINIK